MKKASDIKPGSIVRKWWGTVFGIGGNHDFYQYHRVEAVKKKETIEGEKVTGIVLEGLANRVGPSDVTLMEALPEGCKLNVDYVADNVTLSDKKMECPKYRLLVERFNKNLMKELRKNTFWGELNQEQTEEKADETN